MNHLFNPDHQFNAYLRMHKDGDTMVMIQNHHTCRCYYKGTLNACERIFHHLEKECIKHGKFPLLLWYYRKAKAYGIYDVPLFIKEGARV